MSNKGLAMLAHLEGIALTKYKDSVGVWTIGVGATRTEIKNLASWPMDKKISIEEAFDLLRRSITRYENAINKNLKVDISQHMFDALVSWCYNVGTGWVAKSTIMRLINQGERDKRRLYNALMMYKKPPEIIGRRKKEAILLTEGVYAGNGKASIFPVNKYGRPVYRQGRSVDVYAFLTPEVVKDKIINKQIKKAEKVSEKTTHLADLYDDFKNYFEKVVDKLK